jgi:hypothetical protein
VKAMSLLSAFYVLCVMIFAVSVWAESATERVNPLLTPQEQEIHVRAKKRLYPGGIDEEPLKVQTQLLTPTKKAAVENAEPPEDDANDSTEHD